MEHISHPFPIPSTHTPSHARCAICADAAVRAAAEEVHGGALDIVEHARGCRGRANASGGGGGGEDDDALLRPLLHGRLGRRLLPSG